VTLARVTRVPLSDLEMWHPRDLATLVDQLEEEQAAARRADRRR
jgi:hypothetical protein